jgi:hypothetical protein
MIGVLAVGDEAHLINRFLLHPPLHGRWKALTPAWRAASRLGYSIMPRWACELYGSAGWPDARATSRLRTARRAALLVPWHTRLSFPRPVLPGAVARLGPAAVPLSGLPDAF